MALIFTFNSCWWSWPLHVLRMSFNFWKEDKFIFHSFSLTSFMKVLHFQGLQMQIMLYLKRNSFKEWEWFLDALNCLPSLQHLLSFKCFLIWALGSLKVSSVSSVSGFLKKNKMQAQNLNILSWLHTAGFDFLLRYLSLCLRKNGREQCSISAPAV